MKGLKVKPSQYDAYIKSTTPGMEEALKGQFYEYFCYNELIQNNEEIKIVKSNYTDHKVDGHFIHSKEGKIIYTSYGVDIAEFDVLGIKNNTIYWWEITRSRKYHSKIMKSYERKFALLDKVFAKYQKVFSVILPHDVDKNFLFDYRIIPEPDYKLYFDKGYFKFSKSIKDCISLHDFEKKSSSYDYIDDVIAYSHDYYDNKNYQTTERINNISLFERLYNIKEIKNSKFEYFEIKNGNSGFIEIKGRKIYMDEVLIHHRHQNRARREILALLKRLEYTMQ